MSKASLIQTGYSGGEFSRAVRARHDIESYPNGLELCRGAIPRTNGPADKRPGFVRLGAAKDTTTAFLWVVFRKSTTDVIRIALNGGKMRFWNGATRAQILLGGVPYEVSHPWADADLACLRWWQSGDVMFFAQNGGTYPLKRLKRLANDNWDLADYETTEGPYMARPDGVTLGFADVTGTGVACSADVAGTFQAGHVGALLRAEAISFDGMLTWAFDSAYAMGNIVRHLDNIYEATFAGTDLKSGDSAPIHTSGFAMDGGVKKMGWTFRGFTHGLAIITAFTDDQHVTVDILQHLPYYPDGTGWGTTAWQLGAFCAANGYARAGVLHEERQALGGNGVEPDTAFLSAAADYTPDRADFRPGSLTQILDDDAIRRTMADGEVNPIVDMMSLDALLVFTQGGVTRIAPPSPDEPLTPAGANGRKLVDIPVSELVRPVKTPTSFIFVPFHEIELIEVQRGDNLQPRNLAELADHMIAAGVKNLAWSRYPSKALFTLDQEGYLASLTYSPENTVFAWGSHMLGGDFGGDPPEVDDICSAPGPYRTEEIWASVRRTINGATVRSIEYMERVFNYRRMRLEDACVLDAAGYFNQWNSDPTKTMTFTPSAPGSVTGTLTAAGHAPFVIGQVGREIFMRKVKPTPKPTDVRWPVRYTITGYNSTTSVNVTTTGDFAGLLASQALPQWAFAVNVLSGLTWLEGQQVRVNGDGGDYGLDLDVYLDTWKDNPANWDPRYTVTGGSITLPEPVARGWVGLPYRQHLRSLPINAGDPTGAARGALKRIDRAFVMIDGAAAGVVRRVGTTEAGINIRGRDINDFLGAAPPAADDDVWEELPGGFDRGGQIEFINDTALPAGIAGWVFRTNTNG